MMRSVTLKVVVLLMTMMGAGCGMGLTPRMPAYLGGDLLPPNTQTLRSVVTPLEPTGLLVINDTTDPDSAPPLSDEQLQALTDWLRGRIQQDFPISVNAVLSAEDIPQTGEMHEFVEVGKTKGLRYLLLAILSGAESEVPERFLLGGVRQGGGGRGQVIGYHIENFALAEIALLDVNSRQVLFRAEGRDWASLDRLGVPLASNVFPVIHRAQQTAPIYPAEEQAYDVLRGLAAGEALSQALMHIKEVWRAPS